MARPLTAWRERRRRVRAGREDGRARRRSEAAARRRERRRLRLARTAALWRDPGLRSRAGWVLLAVVTLSLYWIAFGTSPTAYDMDRIGWGTAPFIAAAAALPLLLVRLAPLAGWVTSATGAVALWLLLPAADLPPGTGSPWPWLVVHTLVLLALLAAVTYRVGWVGAVLVWLGTTLLLAGAVDGTDLAPGWAVAGATVAAIGWLAGRLARSRAALSRQEELRASEEAARVVLQERARIARDLHDIVAHRMSLVAVQAETARFRRPGLPDAALEELASIGATAREALAETRTLLGVLRDASDPVATAPQPGVDDVHELVAGARRAGLVVDADLDCPTAGLAAGTSLTAFRVTQEALSNVARHAPGTRTTVRLHRTHDSVTVLVRNSPPDHVTARLPGPAHGLTGMRERVTSVGGTLTAGGTDDGGFEVLAVLPADPVPAAVVPGRDRKVVR
jgi:signal transduction histidine kinase